MKFVFYVKAKTPNELHRVIVETIETWFPKEDWMHNVELIQQVIVQEEGKKRKKANELYFKVTADIYPALKNMVRKYGRRTERT